MKNKLRLLNWISSAAALAYMGFLVFPQVVFAAPVKYKSFEVYAHGPLDEALFPLLDSAENLLRASELYPEGGLKQKLFLCSGFAEFTFFAPASHNAFAVNYPFTQHIFVSASSVTENAVFAGHESKRRKLSAVIAHETTHSLIGNELGFIKTRLLPTWKEEGYCDYVARESSYGWQKGLNAFCSQQAVSSPSYDYFTYRLYVGYLLQSEQLTFRQLARTVYNTAQLQHQVRQRYCQ